MLAGCVGNPGAFTKSVFTRTNPSLLLSVWVTEYSRHKLVVFCLRRPSQVNNKGKQTCLETPVYTVLLSLHLPMVTKQNSNPGVSWQLVGINLNCL